MPTYQYTCTECGQDLEAVQKFTDDSLTECPACTGRLRKVFSAVGVVFKGSGFYRTDSRATSSSSTPPADSKSESRSEWKADSKEAKEAKAGGDSKSSAKESKSSSSAEKTSSSGEKKSSSAKKSSESAA